MQGAQTPPGQRPEMPGELELHFQREGAAFSSELWRIPQLPGQLLNSSAGQLQRPRMDA